jgi:N-acetylmuramoyl-L-alanine amidase
MKLILILITIFNNLPVTLMINPAGDAQNAGRVVGDCYERGLTLQFAEKLQKVIQQKSSIRVVLSRFAGEVIEPMQVANFSNKLQSDMFVSFHFYKTSTTPVINIYYYLKGGYENQLTDGLFLCSYDDSYLFKLNNSRSLADNFYNYCKKLNTTNIEKPIGLPFLPLKGLVAPAIAVEIGLNKSDDWLNYVDLMSNFFCNFLE